MRVVRTKVFQQLSLGSSPITALGSRTQALLPFRAHGKASFLKAGVKSKHSGRHRLAIGLSNAMASASLDLCELPAGTQFST